MGQGWKVSPSIQIQSGETIELANALIGADMLKTAAEAPEEVGLEEWKLGDGRPRGSSHIENIRFWDLPKDK